MKFLFIALCISFFIIQISPAQNTVEENFAGFKQAFSIVPQYAAIYGIRVDYERKLKNGNPWIQFSPQLYLANNSYEEFDELSGMGMNVYYKKYLSLSKAKNDNGMSRSSVYFSTGPTFQYFNLVNVEEVPQEFTENGVTYIQFNPDDVSTKIYKLGANADFGVQFTSGQFFLDFYGGIGMRYSIGGGGVNIENYQDYWFDFGYTGILLDGGIRLGFFIR